MPVLEAVHDFAHPVEGDEAWSESYYFNAYDPETDSGFFTRIGVRPNEGTLDANFAAWLPRNRLALVLAAREQREMTDSDLSAGGVRYQRVAPMKEWRLTVGADAMVVDLGDRNVTYGRLELDATFTALMSPVGTDGQGREQTGLSAAVAETVGKGHLEQAGRWHGSVNFGGTELVWGGEARGNRDKSWGPRKWGGPRMWRWFSINIDDDTHFGGIRIGTDTGDLHRGWVWRDGEATSIQRWDVRTDLEDDGLTHQVTHVRATDKRDRVHELRGDVLRVFGIPQDRGGRRTIVNEALARWTYEGRTGYGIAEYLHQLDDSNNPLTPIE